jgi:polyribonucleotide nucleotidyltransferase
MQPYEAVLRKKMMLQGRELILETGRVALQASGSVLVRYGDTMVLATATASAEPREGIDFFPLTVDYEERLYAVGKIPGGFIKREGRPSEKAILSGRLIDRPIRPLFPKNYRNDVQIVTTVLSVDQDNPPDIVAMIGASAALSISHIPFMGPIGGVRVGLVGEELVINPTLVQTEKSKLNLTVAGTKDAIMMVEAGAEIVSEDVLLEAIMFGHEQIKKIVDFIDDFREEALARGLAKEKVIPFEEEIHEEIINKMDNHIRPVLEKVLNNCAENKKTKQEREALLDITMKELTEEFFNQNSEMLEQYPESQVWYKNLLGKIEKEIVRQMILKDHTRIDGRNLDEVRPITVEVGLLPRTHGSGLFTRGETQVLNVATLGPVGDEQILDGLGVEESKRYMHHYNFPPYSVGEARPLRSPGRREIGHGALAERALEPVLPSEEDFPYTIRLVSEVVGSNGSTSMASVCGSTLSLMDAGVPIKAPVAGVAMGLVKDEEQVAILTDIQGLEDALGDMDFKVAGTKEGVTALQMDIKIAGIDREILKRALEQARQGRLHILDKMLAVIPEPRPELSPFAPRIIRTIVDPEKIRDIIGPGGKIIKKIIEETGVEIDIEDDGRVYIAAKDGEAGEKAMDIIESITKDVEVGKVYVGKVIKTTDFGAFVEIIPGVLGYLEKKA